MRECAMKRLTLFLCCLVLLCLLVIPVQAATLYNVSIWNTNMDGTAYNATTQTFSQARVASPYTWNPSGSPGSDQVKITGASGTTVSLNTFGIMCFSTGVILGNTTISATLHVHTLNATSGFATHNLHQNGVGTMGVTGFDETNLQYSNTNLAFDVINSSLFSGSDFAVNDLDPTWVTVDNDTAIPLNAAGVAYIVSSSAAHYNPMTCLATRYADFDIANNQTNLTLANGNIDDYQYYDISSAKVAGQAPYLTLGFLTTGQNATAISNVSTDNNKPNLAVQFNDTTTAATPTSWNWSFMDYGNNQTPVVTYFSDSRNATNIFGAGNFSVKLIIGDQYGNDSSPGIWINISAGKFRKGLYTPNPTGFRLYPATSVFNTPANTLPLMANSAALAGGLGVGVNTNPYLYVARGLPINYVDLNITRVNVTNMGGSIFNTGTYAIPDYGGSANGLGTDHEINLLNLDTSESSGIYASFIPRQANGTYRATYGGIYDGTSNALSTIAGDRQDPPVIRYDEIVSGTINHAVGFAANNTGTCDIWPGMQWDGQNSSAAAPCIGQRFVLNTSRCPITGYTRNASVIPTALATYGMILTDNAGDEPFNGITADSLINQCPDITFSTYATIHANCFDAVDESALEISANSQMIDPTILRPLTSFTATPTSGTVPLTVTFTDTSTSSPTLWNWTFSDGSLTNATQRNPIHTFAAAGNYSISLNATNAYGSNVSASQVVTVTNPPPVANFTANITAGPVPLTVQFTDLSTGV